MELQLFNSLGRQKTVFEPINPPQVSLYTCGPTVYHYAHVGNLRSYIFADVLKRTLQYNGYTVKHVINITDVGHLTDDDVDSGEDKLEKGARREGKTPLEVAAFYEQAFKQDMDQLNVLAPTVWSRATEHIPQQIAFVAQLVANGFAYETDQAVYFDVSQLADYTALSGQELAAQKIAARDEVNTDSAKRQPADFALWFKRVGRYADHALHWQSPWGDGFPGWHIECSAMSVHHLGQQIDIHTGGIDHIPVHHTNERAQNIGACGQPVVARWMHNEFVVLPAGEKMAKSADNFTTLQTLIEQGYDPLAYRLWLLGTQYRQAITLSDEALDAAKNALEKLRTAMRQLVEVTPADVSQHGLRQQFHTAINDDLNTAQALAVLWEVVKSEESPAVKKGLLLDFDQVLGLGLDTIQPLDIPQQVTALAEQRWQAKQDKDFERSDQLRAEIEQLGYAIEDGESDYRITKL